MDHLCFLNSRCSNSRGSDNSRGSGSNSGNRENSSKCTKNWSMVNDMVGSVGGGVFLDSDLGNMLDLVVNLLTNMLDNRGSGNMDIRGSIGIGIGGSSLDLSNR